MKKTTAHAQESRHVDGDGSGSSVIVFDVDGVLCESKTPIDKEMSRLLVSLSEKKQIIFITGGKFDQIKTQVIDKAPSLNKNVLVMPLNGSELWCYSDKKWYRIRANEVTDEERGQILASIIHVFDSHKPFMRWGEIVEDRGSQITISLLGQKAPWYVKKYYDPTMELRRVFVEDLKERLGDSYEIRIGGSTSIDICKLGVDKGTSLLKLVKQRGIAKEDVIFIGDKLEKGGNDYPVKVSGFKCLEVQSVEDTKQFIESIIKHNQQTVDETKWRR